MNRSKRRGRVHALTRELGAGPSQGSRVAWAVAVTKRPPLLFAQRRRHVVVRTAHDLLLVRSKRRGALEPRDVVARIPYERASVRRRQLGFFRQLVISVEPEAESEKPSSYAIEFRLRDRHFSNGIVRAIDA